MDLKSIDIPELIYDIPNLEIPKEQLGDPTFKNNPDVLT